MRNAHVHSVVRPAPTAAACLVAALAAMPSPALAQNVCATVNGETITDDDIEQRAKFNELANHKSPSRKEIIDELIDDKLKAEIARRYGMDLTGKDVDQQYADMAKRMHMSPEGLTGALDQGGVNATTLKAKILADMSWQSIVRGKGRESVAEAEAGYDYTLRQILFLVPSGNGPLLEQRRKDADALRAQFTSCETGLPLTQAQRDVVVKPTITKNSADFPPALREILDKTEVGHLTPQETTAHGVELVAVCNKKEIEAEPPWSCIHNQLDPACDAWAKAYLRGLRRKAMIERMSRCAIR